MTTEGSITQWYRRLKSPDPKEREEACRQMPDELTRKLLDFLRPQIVSIRAREDEEDIAQSVLMAIFAADASFANRNPLIAYMLTTARNKLSNRRKHHRCQKRDIRLEKPAWGDPSDSGTPGQNLLENGRKTLAIKNEKVDGKADPVLPTGKETSGEPEPSDLEGMVRLMASSTSADFAAIILDLIQSIRAHDAKRGTNLYEILRLTVYDDRKPQEIADCLAISKRTVERKISLIMDLLGTTNSRTAEGGEE
jgi:DNA-directed RNA polymerase specialized sigma24 family protein